MISISLLPICRMIAFSFVFHKNFPTQELLIYIFFRMSGNRSKRRKVIMGNPLDECTASQPFLDKSIANISNIASIS